jgi:ethanolamine ammonia-lyase small subunit
MSDRAPTDPWRSLSRWTSARIGLGRVGASATTQATLDFAMDHAHARDAIHTPLDTAALAQQLQASGLNTLLAWSQARTRTEYLRRPDLGRLLADDCLPRLQPTTEPEVNRLTIIIADGLSSLAPANHALPLIEALRSNLHAWQLDAIVLATQARVALADEIGRVRGAEATLVLIGERPGLKSADSLGAYLTYRPHPGCTDADRNCVSNIRSGGLTYASAAFRLVHLLHGARALGRSGVELKDLSDPLIVSRKQ